MQQSVLSEHKACDSCSVPGDWRSKNRGSIEKKISTYVWVVELKILTAAMHHATNIHITIVHTVTCPE